MLVRSFTCRLCIALCCVVCACSFSTFQNRYIWTQCQLAVLYSCYWQNRWKMVWRWPYNLYVYSELAHVCVEQCVCVSMYDTENLVTAKNFCVDFGVWVYVSICRSHQTKCILGVWVANEMTIWSLFKLIYRRHMHMRNCECLWHDTQSIALALHTQFFLLFQQNVGHTVANLADKYSLRMHW